MHRIHPFDRCGLAPASDLQTPEWRTVFDHLENVQAEFLAQESSFRSPDYPWPRDALHAWSRIWEYPYVYHHIRQWLNGRAARPSPCVVDVGSGVTFFPFAVSQLGCRTVCTDIDPLCGKDLQRAIPMVPNGAGRVEFRLIQQQPLPMADGEADLVYCLSVLEHIPNFEAVIQDMHRALKPGGRLILTIDISWRPDEAISAQRYADLRQALDRYFVPALHETSIHPANLLRSDQGPYRNLGITGPGLPWFLIKQHIIKPLLGRPPRHRAPLLSVWGAVMDRRS